MDFSDLINGKNSRGKERMSPEQLAKVNIVEFQFG